MAIYSRFGAQVDVVANAGQHVPRWAGRNVRLGLVRVRFHDNNTTCYVWTRTLRAEGGPAEIDAAVAAAPEVVLEGPELAAAMKEAE